MYHFKFCMDHKYILIQMKNFTIYEKFDSY